MKKKRISDWALLVGPLAFGLGLTAYMAKTTSRGGNDTLLVAILLVWSGWSLFRFARRLHILEIEQMKARFAWMQHSMEAHTTFLHDELHRYQKIESDLNAGKIDAARKTLNEASSELTELFHDLSANSLPLRLALLERKTDLQNKHLKISTTIIDPDFSSLSLPEQLDLYLGILDFVLEHARAGVLVLRQEKKHDHLVLTAMFSMDSSIYKNSMHKIGKHSIRFVQDQGKGTLIFTEKSLPR